MSAQSARAGSPRTIPEKHTHALRLEPFVGIADDALRAAAGRVSQRWSNEAMPTLSSQDVTFELLELTRAIERSETSLDNEVDSATLVLRRRLLEELRTETLREWTASRAPAPTQMLAILNGFEFAQALLEPQSEDGLAKRLSDPGSLGLVVEVAHDLRSPLTSILFLSETLLRGSSGPLNDLQRRQIGIVYSAALGLINVASDVVEMARGTDDVDPTESVPLSLSAMMEPVRDVVLPMAEEKGVDVRIISAHPDQRFGLPVPLSRVLLNLTTNALKFTDNGFIEIAARPIDGRRVEFSVRDTGCGIDPAALRTLFHPFRRRSGPRSGYYFSGTGLGLTICKRLVHAMGGTLQVDTTPGLGTRFYFVLEMPPCP
jgi:signal transduction histidine kinase